jgi:zinc protease
MDGRRWSGDPVCGAGVTAVIPAIGRPRPVRLPAITDVTLANGLRVLVARRPGIPLFELRMVMPIAARSGAAVRVFSETLLSGTPARTSQDIAETLQAMGASLGTSSDADQLVVYGSSMTAWRRPFFDLVSEIVREASFPADEVAIERERIIEEIALLRSQPGAVAGDALAHRLFGDHPYGWGITDPDAVAKVSASGLRKLHASWLQPKGSLMVLVGDLDAAKTIADIAQAFGTWAAGTPGKLAPPRLSMPASMLLVDRPGSVQTTIRLAGRGLPRTDPAYPALALASTAFGGYFTSRLNDNIREQKGYTYGAHSRVDQRRVSSVFTISTDVGREVTTAALVEIAYELGRMVALPIAEEELVAARRYLQGTMALGIQTQAGLAAYMAAIVSSGLPVTHLRDYPRTLDKVTVADVQEAARRFLAPSALTTVLVGDAAAIAPGIEALGVVATER